MSDQIKGPAQSSASPSLVFAALAGMMGAGLAGCGKTNEKIVEVSPAAPTVTSTTIDTTMNLAKFSTACDTRGGLVETHASCAGANSCKGVSFLGHSGKLTEHGCKALNGCAGMSCVDLPKDAGLTGADILIGTKDGSMVGSETQCNFCHSPDTKADPNVNPKAFKLPIAPGIAIATGVATYNAKTEKALVNAIAFGVHGVYASGEAYANMPGFYATYSAAEIKRLVTYIKTLPVQGVNWENPK